MSSVVAPREFAETGRGLGATADVARGTVLLAVPFRLCFSKIVASMAAELRSFAPTIGLREQDLVILHLLIERSKGEASPHASHVAAIPAVYDMPLFWTASELAELEGSGHLKVARVLTEQVQSDYTALVEALRSVGQSEMVEKFGVTLPNYQWATASLWSRCCDVLIKGTPARVLAPDFDMFNHDPSIKPGSSHEYDPDTRSIQVKATRDYKKDEQVFISYGPVANWKLIMWYGFAVPSNEFDSVDLFLSLDPSDGTPTGTALWRRKRKLLNVAGCRRYVPEVYIPGETKRPAASELTDASTDPESEVLIRHQLKIFDPVPGTLLTMMRVLGCGDSSETLEHLEGKSKGKGKGKSKGKKGGKLPGELEIGMLQELKGALRMMLSGYKTTIKDDEAVLVDSATPYRMQLATMLRLAEKRILAAGIAHVDATIEAEQERLSQ